MHGPPNPLWYRFVCFIVRNGFYRVTGGISSVGRNNVPRTGPVLIAPNHVSNLDPPATAVMCPRILRFMAKEELFANRILGGMISSVGAFPLKRGESDTEAVRFAISELQAGRSVLIFPEGTRGDGQTLGPVNRGVAMMARRGNAQVVPVALVGTYQKWPKGSKMLKWGRVRVCFGTPFTYASLAEGRTDKEAREAFVAEWERQIVEMSTEHGSPVSSAPRSPRSKEPDPR